LQRTYNSQEERPGPFGVGWTHAYDIRMEEENPTTNETSESLNVADRTDFFGAKHKYHRDCDGLYSPPPYLFDETSSGERRQIVPVSYSSSISLDSACQPDFAVSTRLSTSAH